MEMGRSLFGSQLYYPFHYCDLYLPCLASYLASMIDLLVYSASTAVAEDMLETQAAVAAVAVAELPYRRLVRSSHLSLCQSEISPQLPIRFAKAALAEAEETGPKKTLKRVLTLETMIQMLNVGLASADSEELAESGSAVDPPKAELNGPSPWTPPL